MTHVVILPHVIEQKLKENERQEVIDFVNALVDDTSGELKRDVIEIIGEKFERKLSVEIVNLKDILLLMKVYLELKESQIQKQN